MPLARLCTSLHASHHRTRTTCLRALRCRYRGSSHRPLVQYTRPYSVSGKRHCRTRSSPRSILSRRHTPPCYPDERCRCTQYSRTSLVRYRSDSGVSTALGRIRSNWNSRPTTPRTRRGRCHHVGRHVQRSGNTPRALARYIAHRLVRRWH
jgi:hypothetical protein